MDNDAMTISKYQRYLLLCRNHARIHERRGKMSGNPQVPADQMFVIDEQTGNPICLLCSEVITDGKVTAEVNGQLNERIFKGKVFEDAVVFEKRGSIKLCPDWEDYDLWFHSLTSYTNRRSWRDKQESEYDAWLNSITPSAEEVFGIEWDDAYLYQDRAKLKFLGRAFMPPSLRE